MRRMYTTAVAAGIAAMLLLASTAGAQDSCKCRVADSADGICPLLVSDTVPDVTLKTIDGKPFRLLEEVQKQPTVLIFYRGGWCGYCNRQLAGLQEIEGDLSALGYRILAIAPNLPEKLTETIDRHSLTYTLLSDVSMEAATAFGIVFKLDEATQKRFEDRNTFVEYSGVRQTTLPVPAAYVVGTDGVIQFEFISPKYSVRVEPAVLLAAAKAAVKGE